MIILALHLKIKGYNTKNIYENIQNDTTRIQEPNLNICKQQHEIYKGTFIIVLASYWTKNRFK